MAKTKKIEFNVTVGYKAVVSFSVKAEDEQSARQQVLEKLRVKGIYEGELQDENYQVSGCVDMDSSWNMVQN